jgi:hypothetical protein
MDPNEKGVAVTIACPIVLIVFYGFMLRLRKDRDSGPSIAIFAICGMWVLALWFALWAQEVRAPGAPLTLSQLRYLLVSSFLPWRIAGFLALEGSIFALLIGTVAMVISHIVFERTRWIIPPSLWAALHHSKE